MPTKNNHKQDVQITRLQTDITWIKSEVEDIKGNHLHSIYKELSEIKINLFRRPTWLISGIFAGIVSLLVGLLVYILT